MPAVIDLDSPPSFVITEFATRRGSNSASPVEPVAADGVHPQGKHTHTGDGFSLAVLIVSDLLAGSDGTPLIDQPLRDRRRALQSFVRARFAMTISPAIASGMEPGSCDGVPTRRPTMHLRPGQAKAGKFYDAAGLMDAMIVAVWLHDYFWHAAVPTHSHACPAGASL
jgi:hypothetical protein